MTFKPERSSSLPSHFFWMMAPVPLELMLEIAVETACFSFVFPSRTPTA